MEVKDRISWKAVNRHLKGTTHDFRHEKSLWEEKYAAVRLGCRMNKSTRNKLWKKKKRQCVAEMRAKEPERSEQADREADEWREREVAKDMANRKVDEMKAIDKMKAKRERKRLAPEI